MAGYPSQQRQNKASTSTHSGGIVLDWISCCVFALASRKTKPRVKQRWSIRSYSIRKSWEVLRWVATRSFIKRLRKLSRHGSSAQVLRSYSEGPVIVEEFFWKTSGDTNLSQATTFHNPGLNTQTEAGNPNLGCQWTSTGNSKCQRLVQKNLGRVVLLTNLIQTFRHSHSLPTFGVFESTL